MMLVCFVTQTPKSPMPRHRGGFSRSRRNRDSRFPESRDPDQTGIPGFPNPGIPAQSGSGKSRRFSRPNRGGTGRGFGDFGVWLRITVTRLSWSSVLAQKLKSSVKLRQSRCIGRDFAETLPADSEVLGTGRFLVHSTELRVWTRCVLLPIGPARPRSAHMAA
jgi:hypothetical protein